MLVHGQTIEYHRPGNQFDHVKTSPIQLLILSRASSSRTMEGRWLNPLRTNLKISPFPPGPGTVVVGRHLLTLAFDARRAIMNNQLWNRKRKVAQLNPFDLWSTDVGPFFAHPYSLRIEWTPFGFHSATNFIFRTYSYYQTDRSLSTWTSFINS